VTDDRPEAGRRSGPGRRPGSEDTRGRILAAARHRFGERGYDGATVRDIAAEAGVDAALVHHYFGTKQQLFVAAVEFPIDAFAVAPQLLAGPPDRLGERLVAFVLGVWEQPAVRSALLGVVRSATTDAVAAAMLRDLLASGPFLALARAIDRPDADLRAALVGSQLVGLALARYVVGVEPLASAPTETVAAAIGPTIQRYLVGEVSEAGPGVSRRPPAARSRAG
jgi:AcrR family transcriptional regulator